MKFDIGDTFCLNHSNYILIDITDDRECIFKWLGRSIFEPSVPTQKVCIFYHLEQNRFAWDYVNVVEVHMLCDQEFSCWKKL